MQLRTYQSEAVAAILGTFAQNQSTLSVLATGTGKTIIFSHVAQSFLPGGGKVMVVAHREELIWQAAAKIELVTGEAPDIEMAEYQANSGLYAKQVVVSSIQTLNAGKGGEGRMTRFDPQAFSLLIIDEAHHATAKSYRKVIKYFRQNPRLKILGVTATPDRADEEALGQVFGTAAFEYDVVDAIRDGWLVPIVQRAVHIEGLDYSSIRTTAGDLNGSDLARVLEYEENLHAIACPTLELTGDRKTLVFAATVDQAERLAEIFNRHKPGSAMFVWGETPKEERRLIFSEYAKGRFQYLVNVGVATEGFDDPTIEVIVMGRPTKSRALYAQMVGRGTRVHPLAGIDGKSSLTPEVRRQLIAASRKPHVEVIDFVGNSGKHKLVTTADILGGKCSDEVIKKAKAKAESGGRPVDMLEALDEAQRELQEEKEKARRLALRVKAKYKTSVQDPFDVLHIEPWVERGWHKGRPPTEKQLAVLEKSGVPLDQVKTFTQASQLIDTLFQRRDQRQCTFKQAKTLARYGFPTDMTFDQARSVIDTLAANGWKRSDRPKRVVEVF